MRGDESFSHAAIIDLTNDASRAGVTVGVLCRCHRSMPAARRFPPPWTVEETAPCFIVRDANEQALAFVYCEDEPEDERQQACSPAMRPDGSG